MSSTPLYIPCRTGTRTAALGDDNISKHRTALFEPLRTDSFETRAHTLAQIGSNLVSWTRLAYPDSKVARSTNLSKEIEAEAPLPKLRRCRDSNDGVFDLDADDEWSDDETKVTTNASSLSLPVDISPQTPPYSSLVALQQDQSDADYSMYGVESTIFDSARPMHELREILRSYLLTVLRASVDCPYADVRRYSRYILHHIHRLGATVPDLICDGPSWLIPAVETVAYCHDAASERPAEQASTESDPYRMRSNGHSNDSWGSGSYLSDVSDAETAGSPYKRGRSAALSPSGSPPKRDASSSNADVQDTNEIVFESEDETFHDRDSTRSSSVSRTPSPKPRPSAIPIAHKKSGRVPPDCVDIDDILLGPVSSHGTRRARFSLQHDSPALCNRPALNRKRTNSFAATLHQRRATRNLRYFHLACYQNTGRISNLGRILSYFPRFYETTLELHDELIRKQGGPLQRIMKLYLAILAASQAKCQYLVSYFTKKYVQFGENLDWLENLSKSSRKVRRLGKINALLAHQPWRVSKQDIEELLSRSRESMMNGDASDQWTMSELVQAICILIVVNCQAHFCLAVGVVPEPDTFGGACIRKKRQEVVLHKGSTVSVDVFPLFTSYDSRTFASPSSFNPEFCRDSMPAVQPGACVVLPPKQSASAMSITSTSSAEHVEDSLPNLLWKRRNSMAQAKLWRSTSDVGDHGAEEDFKSTGVFARCGIVDDMDISSVPAPETVVRPPYWASASLARTSPGTTGFLSPMPSHGDLALLDPEIANMPVNPILEDMSRFYDPQSQLGPTEFDLSSSEYSVLRLADYNWEDHACSLVGRFVPDLESVLDHNLQEARDAAGDDDDGFFFSSENGPVDQGPLRDAVWFFILRLYGIYNDGYEYRDVNLLLNKSAKRFLKKVCFVPEQISRDDWQSVGRGLKSQEKVLLALLASHARMYVCLIYAFRYCE